VNDFYGLLKGQHQVHKIPCIIPAQITNVTLRKDNDSNNMPTAFRDSSVYMNHVLEVKLQGFGILLKVEV
jgi:hypothetical protein